MEGKVLIDRRSLPRHRASDEPAFTRADLLARGWSKAAIGHILGQPDERIQRYGGGIITYFHASRVQQAESKTQHWRKSEKRAAASTKTAATRAASLLKTIEEMEVHVTVLPMRELRKRALQHFGQLAVQRGWEPPDVCDESWHQRIAVNYIRHCLTRYDSYMDSLIGKVGRQDAMKALRQRFYDAIAEHYPELAAECSRQMVGVAYSAGL